MRTLIKYSLVFGLILTACGDDVLSPPPDASVDSGPATDASPNDGMTPPIETPPPACESELGEVSHSIEVGQGPESFADADSDENGLNDRDEWGQLAAMPEDTDLDATPDYEDYDDDGDGLLDIYDEERLTPVEVVDRFDESFAGPWLFRARTVFEAGRQIRNLGRQGETLRLEGEGLDCEVVVGFLGSETPINTVASAGDDGALWVTVPVGAQGPVAIYQDGVRSNLLDVEIATDDEPLLFDLSDPTVAAGSEIVLSGINLGEVDNVVLNGSHLTPRLVDDDRVDVEVPNTFQAPLDEVYVETPEGTSNRIYLRVVREIDATYAPSGSAPESATGLTVLHNRLAEAELEDGVAAVQVAADAIDVVTIVAEDKAIFEALVLPSDDAVELSAESSAIKAALLISGARERLSSTSLPVLRDQMLESSELGQLTSAMAAAVGASEGLANTDAYSAELISAVNATDALILDGLDSGALVPPHSEAGVVPALIRTEVTGFDVSLMQIASTGQIFVDNGTPLYVSAQATEYQLDRTIISHVDSAFSPAIIDADETERIGGPGSQRPRIVRDARVEIVTAGSSAPSPETETAITAQRYLVIRTVVEAFLVPLMEFAVGRVVDGRLIIGLLIEHAWSTVVNMVETYNRNDIGGALYTAFAFLKAEAASLISGELEGGPFLVGLLEALFDSVGAAVALVSTRLARKLAPGPSQVENIVDGISLLADGVTAVRTFAAMISTPGAVDFDVTFGLAVTELRPDEQQRGCVPGVVIIEGAGFYPQLVDGDLMFPEVTIRDTHPFGFGTQRYLAADFLSREEGGAKITSATSMDIPLSENVLISAIGPLEVEVTHYSRGEGGLELETVMGPRQIPVTSELELDAIDPATSAVGETISLEGRGFDAARNLEVIFTEPMSTTVVARATPTNVTATSMDVVVPDLPTTRREWWISARQGAIGCQVRTQPQVLGIAGEGVFEVIDITHPFGGRIQFKAINDVGQAVVREPSTSIDMLVTPSGSPQVWWMDSDGDNVNDLGMTIEPIGSNSRSDARHINNAGFLGGATDGNGPAYWEDPAMGSGIGNAIRDHINDVIFPDYGISFAMQPTIESVSGINSSGAVMVNTQGATSIVWNGDAALFVGGDPICMGCIVGRQNVGTLIFQRAARGTDLNDAGIVCGMVQTEGSSPATFRPATWPAGGMPTMLEDYGIEYTRNNRAGPLAINNSAAMAGSLREVDAQGPQRAVMWQGSTLTELGTLGGEESEALDIDDMGAIIGWADDADGVRQSFLYLPAPRWGLSAGMHDFSDLIDGDFERNEVVSSMNNFGHIVTSEGRLLRPR